MLRERLGLGEPYRDPAVSYFGLVNAVFAVGDSFLEVVSPVAPEVPGARTAVRQLERSGSDVCGYMAMLQVDDLASARERARAHSVREVFEVEVDDMVEVHLHPGDMMGAIVALSEPRPATSWRWGGEGWSERSVPGQVAGITVAVPDAEAVAERWSAIAGGPVPGCRFIAGDGRAGIVEIELRLGGRRHVITPGGDTLIA